MTISLILEEVTAKIALYIKEVNNKSRKSTRRNKQTLISVFEDTGDVH